MLDDPFDFFLNWRQQQQQAPDVAKQQLLKPYAPQEEDTALSKILGKGVSGLSWVAGALDKGLGGRAIRGALGGKPQELLSAIPFSDSLGITDETNRVSGEDLAKQWGLLEGGGTKGEFELRDLVGPGIEAALDPASYLTFGGSALTKAGQAAKRVGALPERLAGRIRGYGTLDDVARAIGRPLPEATAAASKVGVNLNDLLNRPLGGLAGVRLPFSEPAAILGTGPRAQQIADTAGHWWDKALYSSPGRSLSAAFDPAVHGAFNQDVQRNWRLEKTAERARDVQRRLDALHVADPLLGSPSLHDASTMQGPIRSIVEGTSPATPFAPEILDSAERLKNLNASNLARAQEAGLRMEELSSQFGTNYAARAPTPIEEAERIRRGLPREQSSHQLYAGIGPGIQREPILDVPGGTEAINRMVADPRVGTSARALNGPAAEAILANEYIKPNVQRLAQLRQMESVLPPGQTLAPALAQELALEAHKEAIIPGLASYLGGLDPQRATAGLFGNDVISDTLRAHESIDRAIGRANVATRTLGDAASISKAPLPGTVSAADVITSLGLDRDRAAQNLYDLLAKRGIQAPPNLAHVRVPEDVARAVQSLTPKLTAPDYLEGPLGLFDRLTNLTKTHLTAEWPGKHVRDLTSSTVQNIQQGAPGAVTFGGPAMAALRRAEDVPGLAKAVPQFAGMTDAEASKELARQVYAQTGYRRHGGLAREGLTPADPISQAFAKTVPGVAPQPTLPEIIGNAIPKSGAELNPLNVEGWGGRTQTQFAPVRAGRQAGDMVDDLTRGGMMADLLRQSYTPDAAGRLAEATHFNYGNLTDFERKVMRRLVPFYGWQRNAVPQQLSLLAQAPGGLSGQGIRFSDAFRQQAGFLPPYLGGGLAVPMGQEQDGTQRYLTRLDMPWENPFEMISTGPGGLAKTGMKALGQLNPLIKGPLELLTNRQFYSGREPNDLYSQTGSTAADQVLANSPLSRYATTFRTLRDTRKDPLTQLLNLGTGARLSDVDVDKQRTNVAMDYIKETLKSDPNVSNYETLSVPADKLKNLTPDEVELLRLFKSLQRHQSEEAKKRKAAAVQR